MITTHNNSFVFESSSWFSKYRDKSSTRYPTFKAALGLFLQRGGRYIVETGCVRLQDDWGAGYSTMLFGEFLQHYGGYLWSVDINHKNVILCNQLTEPYANHRLCIQGDSVDFLEHRLNQMFGFEGKIDLLYLDSYDYPYGHLLHHYGKDYHKALDAYNKLSDSEAMARHSEVILPCQRHCLSEFKAAEKYLHNKSIVLVDDANMPGGGKAGLVRDYLPQKGWICVLDLQQSLWIKEPINGDTQGDHIGWRSRDSLEPVD